MRLKNQSELIYYSIYYKIKFRHLSSLKTTHYSITNFNREIIDYINFFMINDLLINLGERKTAKVTWAYFCSSQENIFCDTTNVYSNDSQCYTRKHIGIVALTWVIHLPFVMYWVKWTSTCKYSSALEKYKNNCLLKEKQFNKLQKMH